MPPTPLPKELTQDIQSTPQPLFGPLSTPPRALTPSGPLGMLQPGVAPPRSELERAMPPGLSLSQRLKAYGPGLLGSLVALGGRGPLTRTVGGALTAGGAEKLMGGSFGPEAARFAGTQGIAELAFGAGRFGKGQVRARRALEQAEKEFATASEAHQKAVEQQAAQHRVDLEKHQTTVTGFKTQYRDQQAQRAQVIAQQQADFAKTQRTFAEQGATKIAQAYQSEVPSWKDFPANEQGLAEMVYGKGQARVSEMYDRALKEVVSTGRGQQVPMRVEDVDALKLTASGLVDAPSGKPTHAYVDAGDLASALPGTWKNPKTRGAYRRGFEVLDQFELGNEAARGEYRAAQSLIEYTDKAKMLAGGQFDPEAARQALYQLKNVNVLRHRGAGDVFRGPIAETVQAPGPLAPTPPPKVSKPVLPPRPLQPSPLKPPEPPQTGITKKSLPVGHALGGIAGLAAGHPFGHPYIGFGIGAGIGGTMGPHVTLYRGGPPVAPTPPILPTGLAELLRLYLTRPTGIST